jgi:DNA repair exonuclease SbcCD ATPase subunit
MMNRIFSIIALLLCFTAAQAQFSEAIRPMSQGNHSSFMVDFRIGEADDIVDIWQDYQKDFDARKPKKDKKTGEYFADNAEIEGISENTIDIYSTVQGKGKAGGAVVTVWFNLGGAYLSSDRHPERIEAANEWLQGFKNRVLERYAEEALKAEEDKLDDLEDELKDLQKEKKKAEDDVADLQKALEEAKAKVRSTIEAIGAKEAAVEQQKEIVKMNKKKVKKLD